MTAEIFDSDVSLNNITGLDKSAANHLDSPSLDESPSSSTDQGGPGRPENQEKQGGSSRKNHSSTEGSRREAVAAYYNGFNDGGRYV